MSTDPYRRASAALAEAADAVREMRLMVALARDEQPTREELAAKLAVYGEFGR